MKILDGSTRELLFLLAYVLFAMAITCVNVW